MANSDMTRITPTIEEAAKAKTFLSELAHKPFIKIDSINDEKEINSWREK